MAASRTLSGSQTLFNIYYLGQTKVDRRCNAAMMPWIIEELKLKAREMNFIWLSPGREEVSFVADDGKELFNHSYGNILHCCIAVDGISFAYAVRQEKDKYFCHVFQALTYEEADKIMTEFKEHSQEEVTVPPTINHNMTSSSPSPMDGKSSGFIMSRSHSFPRQEEYKLDYWGRFEVSPPASGNIDQVVLVDTLVAKYRDELGSSGSKFRSKKRSFGSRFMRSSTTKVSSSIGVEGAEVGLESLSDTSLKGSPRDSPSDSPSQARHSPSQLSEPGDSPVLLRDSRRNSDGQDIPITFTAASPTHEEGEEGEGSSHREPSTSPEDPADHHSMCIQASCDQTATSHDQTATSHDQTATSHDQTATSHDQTTMSLVVNHRSELATPTNAAEPNGRVRSVTSDFDTLPELANLKGSTEFQALSLKGAHTVQKVRLLFSGVSVVVYLQQSQQIVLKKLIQNIACCAQGKKETDFVTFISRSKENKKYYCYLFGAKNSRMAIKVLESFKSAVVHALSLTMPPAVCEGCPYNKIQQLCKSLEGVSTQVAQSKIQDCLSTLSEADYNQLMLQYKSSEHADHEYTQIIVLVALLRQHFQRRQEKHTHRGLMATKLPSHKPPVHGNSVLEESSSRLTVPALTRAKNAITSSFENLRSKPVTDKKQRSKPDSQQMDLCTQSLTGRTVSPLFARRTSINTLMAPVSTSPMGGDGAGRERSWTAGVGEILRRPQSQIVVHDPSSTKDQSREKTNEDKGSEKDVFKTPHRSFAPSRRSFGSEKGRRLRHSLTPPSSAADGKYIRQGHRRSSSNVVSSSWRQEIFDSVCTPTKLERAFPSFDSEILDEWQVIEIGGTGITTVQDASSSPRTRACNRWRNAIKQQILLNRMEKENQLFNKEGKSKLKTHTFEPESTESLAVWEKLLEQDADHSTPDIHEALLIGVPASRREEVWQLLSDLYQSRNQADWQYPEQLRGRAALDSLGQQTTEYEHSIEVDLSRTFPSHPYFSSNLLEAGQSELHRILHGYAVADPETGYCQGLSFVTGIILMHTKDELSAFTVLYKLMNLHGYKDIYKGSLSNLQTRLYQLSRLMHDFIPAIHQLLQKNEVTPFFYAAPWFLTIFASQYPISFTARVFDFLFYEGTDILFKVALSLLKVHESAILECDSMESICNYLKMKLPEQAMAQQDIILEQALQFDFEGKLELFETEYQVLEELNARFCVDMPVVQDMENITSVLRRNNLALVEQLAICHGSITSLQQQMETLRAQVLTQQQRITRLECENSTLSKTDNQTDDSDS